MKSNKKILIIRYNAIGDIVLSTIIPYAIKLKHPECEIHYLTTKRNSEILKNCPHVDKIMVYKGNIFGMIKKIFKERYDCIVSLNYTLKNYLLGFLSFPSKLVFKSSKGSSWVENNFYTAKKVYNDIELPERLYLKNSDSFIEFRILKKLKEYPKPHIVINPGRFYEQTRQGRIWNIDKWKELSKKLLKTYGGTIFVNGSSKERDYHLQLEDENVVVLSGMYNLKESFALLSLADIVISGDSGPVHIASAYNRNTIAILGSTSPDKIKPYGENGYCIEPKSECKYCWKKKCKYLKNNTGYAPCIESINVEDVMKKIAEKNLLSPALCELEKVQ